MRPVASSLSFLFFMGIAAAALAPFVSGEGANRLTDPPSMMSSSGTDGSTLPCLKFKKW